MWNNILTIINHVCKLWCWKWWQVLQLLPQKIILTFQRLVASSPSLSFWCSSLFWGPCDGEHSECFTSFDHTHTRSYFIIFFKPVLFVFSPSIKDYITPNIPHPKATLAQMHRVIQFIMCVVASLRLNTGHSASSYWLFFFSFSGSSFHFQSWDIQRCLHTPCGLRRWKAIWPWASRWPGWAALQSSQFLKHITEWNGHESRWMASKRSV